MAARSAVAADLIKSNPQSEGAHSSARSLVAVPAHDTHVNDADEMPGGRGDLSEYDDGPNAKRHHPSISRSSW